MVGSAVTVSAEGVVPVAEVEPLTFSQETLLLNAKKETELPELVTLMVCDTAAPPAWAERAKVVLSTLNV